MLYEEEDTCLLVCRIHGLQKLFGMVKSPDGKNQRHQVRNHCLHFRAPHHVSRLVSNTQLAHHLFNHGHQIGVAEPFIQALFDFFFVTSFS